MTNKTITISSESNINDALTKLCSDESLQKEFLAEPLTMLKKMGVESKDLLVRRYDYKDMKIDTLSGTAASAVQICVSVGALVGASIGWDNAIAY